MLWLFEALLQSCHYNLHYIYINFSKDGNLSKLVLSIIILSWWSVAYAIDLSPKSSCDQLVSHSYYKVCYADKHRQALWTFHKINSNYIKGSESRTNDYRFDPGVSNPVDSTDYKGSGFDRGHLVPAADMKLNFTSMSETFYMSNMSPQRASFNRAIWKQLEDGIRKQVLIHGEAFIVTAPVLKPGLPKLSSGVSIPEKFFKIVYFPRANIMRAYLLENRSYKGQRYTEFQVTVDHVESLTKIDFFHNLEKSLQKSLESSLK